MPAFLRARDSHYAGHNYGRSRIIVRVRTFAHPEIIGFGGFPVTPPGEGVAIRTVTAIFNCFLFLAIRQTQYI